MDKKLDTPSTLRHGLRDQNHILHTSETWRLAMETIHPFPPQVASLYQRWLEKRLFSDKRL
jgi:hypothetical protein